MNAVKYAGPVCLAASLVAAATLVAMPLAPDAGGHTLNEASGPPTCPSRPLSIEEMIVTETADGVRAVTAADLDGDGDTDLAAASFNSDTIAWYENDGGVFVEHVLSASADGAQTVFAIDLDGVNGIDVIAGSNLDDTVRWFENDGMNPPTFTEHVLANPDNPRQVYGADIDGDGDIDVVVASSNDATVAWYENDGGVFTRRVITNTATGVISAVAFDIDNDNDMDVVAGYGSNVEWYENDGGADPTFTTHSVTNTLNAVQAVYAADLDGDADGDILSASLIDNTVAWYENVAGVFTKHVISNTVSRASSVYAAQLDDDGNMDVLAASSNDDTAQWYRSDGGSPPVFSEFIITTRVNNVQDVIAADVDGDAQLDAVTASVVDDKVAWFRLSEPEYGVCCLSDTTCVDLVCLSECAAVFGWKWEPNVSCDDVMCPGLEDPALFLVEHLNIDKFCANIQHLDDYETRYWDTPENAAAVLWIAEQLEQYGYDNVVLDPYDYLGNEQLQPYATKIGKTRPNEMYILGAHMDSININNPALPAPGADDDGSGTSSVMEMARIFAHVETDVSIRFVLWNNEETGLNGSSAYVESHKDLQGQPGEPVWLGMIQQDMIMYDRFPVRDVDVEYQATADDDGHARIFAAFVAGTIDRYGTGEFLSELGPNMRNTDSVPFMEEVMSISLRENRRDEIGEGSNPHWHQATDRKETYTDQDYRQGFETCRIIAGAIGELVGARPHPCPADVNRDGVVSFPDILEILGAWGSDAGLADINLDMSVDFQDLLLVLGAWGDCPE